MPSLSAEVARSCPETRSYYEAEILRLVEALSAALPPDTAIPARQRAWAMLALLAGGATLARSVEDGTVALEIAAAVTEMVVRASGEDEDAATSQPAAIAAGAVSPFAGLPSSSGPADTPCGGPGPASAMSSAATL